MTDPVANIDASRRKLLNLIADAPDVTFVRLFGNIGDQLIFAGTRQLLAMTLYSELSICNLDNSRGHTALLAGGGGWCKAFHELPEVLRLIDLFGSLTYHAAMRS